MAGTNIATMDAMVLQPTVPELRVQAPESLAAIAARVGRIDPDVVRKIMEATDGTPPGYSRHVGGVSDEAGSGRPNRS